MAAEMMGFNFNASNLLMLSRRLQSKMATDFKAATKSVHAEAAQRIQQGMVDSLKERVKLTGRHQRGTEHLETSLLSTRNASVTQRGFDVLIPKYMNRSPAALYWRRIEEGDQTTFNGYILFTNDMEGGRRFGPWSPGSSPTGHRGYSAAKSSRTGQNFLSSRQQPPGYKHTRMPQHAGAYVQNIGPFPEYRFTDGGAAAFDGFNFYQHYEKALGSVGLQLSEFVR